MRVAGWAKVRLDIGIRLIWTTILFCTASKSKIGRPSGRAAGTEVLATGMFAVERTSSSAAPAGQASRSGKIRSSVRNAEREERRTVLGRNQWSPLPSAAGAVKRSTLLSQAAPSIRACEAGRSSARTAGQPRMNAVFVPRPCVTRAKCRRAAISARSPGGLRPVPAAPSFSAGSCSLWSPEGRPGVLRLGTQGRPQARNPARAPIARAPTTRRT